MSDGHTYGRKLQSFFSRLPFEVPEFQQIMIWCFNILIIIVILILNTAIELILYRHNECKSLSLPIR